MIYANLNGYTLAQNQNVCFVIADWQQKSPQYRGLHVFLMLDVSC